MAFVMMREFLRVGRVVVLILASGGVVIPGRGVAAPATTIDAAESQAQRQTELMLFRLRMFHHEAASSMLSSLGLAVFTDYFLLGETGRNRYNDRGEIQLTARQNKLRKEMEEWSLVLHKRFPIAESCLVDRTGQEHLRVVGGKVQPSSLFSTEESDAPFFAPTLGLDKGKVFISEPYMSSDAYEWVTAFASPVVDASGTKLGFYHFEVSLSVYQMIIRTRDFSFSSTQNTSPDRDEEGWFFIVDGKGLLIADSRRETSYVIPAERHPEKAANLPDYLPPERMEKYLRPLSSISTDPAFTRALAAVRPGETGHIALTVDGKPYVLAYGPVPDRPWTLFHLDPVSHTGFWD
ncbi:MAG: cache domain-containing protein [Alphaproteobacteria bacterium]